MDSKLDQWVVLDEKGQKVEVQLSAPQDGVSVPVPSAPSTEELYPAINPGYSPDLMNNQPAFIPVNPTDFSQVNAKEISNDL